jgi:hypothetical protein
MAGGGNLPLPEGYSARVDPYNYGQGSSFEVHVFDKNADEVGIIGPNGWINKHDVTGEPDLPDTVRDSVRGIVVDELRRRALIPEKGQGDIKGVPMGELITRFLNRSTAPFLMIPNPCYISPQICNPNRL